NNGGEYIWHLANIKDKNVIYVSISKNRNIINYTDTEKKLEIANDNNTQDKKETCLLKSVDEEKKEVNRGKKRKESDTYLNNNSTVVQKCPKLRDVDSIANISDLTNINESKKPSEPKKKIQFYRTGLGFFDTIEDCKNYEKKMKEE